MHVFGIHTVYILVVLVEVQLCFWAPFIYGDFIAVAAGQSDIFYHSFEVMELAMHYHYTKDVAVLNRIEEPTPKYMVELFISCSLFSSFHQCWECPKNFKWIDHWL